MKQIKHLRSTELGNSLLIVAILVGLAAILGLVGFFVWNRIQQEQAPGETSPVVTSQPPPRAPATTETNDLDSYLADLDETDVNSLDNPQ